MKTNYVLRLLTITAGLLLAIATSGWGQGFESFDNSTAPGKGSYGDGSFTGDNGFVWSFVHARDEGDYPIDGNGLMLRRSDEPSSLSATIPGGIGNFSVDTRKAFTGNTQRKLELVINGDVVAQHEPAFGDGEDDTVIPFVVNDINVHGEVSLSLRMYGASGNQQIILDNISWTGFTPAGDTPPDVNKPSVTELSAFSAKLSAEVVSDGGAAVTGRGFVFAETATNADPEIDGTGVTQISSGIGTGVFSESVPGLTSATNYSVKAYAENDEGLTYSGLTTFYTLPTLGLAPHAEGFGDFLSAETLPAGWSVTDARYDGDWGEGFSAGLRGNDNVLGYQHTGTTGVFSATLSLVNDTDGTIEALEVSYLGRVQRVDETRHPQWTVYVDGNEVPALSYSTAAGIDETRSAVVPGLNIANGEHFTIVWSSDGNVGSSGSRRQIGIGSLSVGATDPPPLPTPLFSLTAGTYFANQTVFVSNFDDYDESVSLYYSIDGEDPGIESPAYDHDVGILLTDGNGPITLKAIAIEGEDESQVAAATYVFPKNVADVAAFRAGTNGKLYRIIGEVAVLHRHDFRNRHFVRDASGSLTIRDEDGQIVTSYVIGDGVTGFVGEKATRNSNALVVMEALADPGTATAAGLDVAPVTLPITDIQLEHTGNLVRIEGASFDAVGTFSTNTNYSISDGSERATMDFRTDFFDADYIGEDIPAGTGIITGIIGGFGEDPQITARDLEDLDFDDPPAEGPTNHPTNFTATTNSSSIVTVAWTDADPPVDGYLIKGSDDSFEAITEPVDGMAEMDGDLVKNVAFGVEVHQFTSLTPSTNYHFRIFPYNGLGETINYKTDDAPQASASTTGVQTYSWTGADEASWQVASNWSPERVIPDPADIIRFQGGEARTVTSVPTQTIGQLLLSNNTALSLQSDEANALTLAGGTGVDLVVEPGSYLHISGPAALQIILSEGAQGSISGSVSFSGAGHRLLSPDASGITFNAGSQFTSDAGFSGNPFGNVNPASVIFAGGSTFVYTSGSNPFASSEAVSVFQTGSLYIHRSSNSPSFSGRTYADFEYDFDGSASASGGSAVSIDNLKVTQGSFNINVTAAPGHSIKGDVEVSPGARLKFNPASEATISFNGAGAAQTISGGGTISATLNSGLVIDNPDGVTLEALARLQDVTISENASLSIGPTGKLEVMGTLTNENTGSRNEAGLIIQSNAAGTGSLIHNTENVEAIVERHIGEAHGGDPGDLGLHWHFISSPVAGQLFDPGFTDGSLFAWFEPAQTWVSHNDNHHYPTWNHFMDDPSTEIHEMFLPGLGYIYAPAFNGGKPDHTKRFIGSLNSGEMEFSLQRAAHPEDPSPGFNLLGNPYPSAIDWHKADRGLFEDDFAYLHDLSRDGGPGYVTLDASEAGAYIPPMHAFFVQAEEAGGFLFTRDMRAHMAETERWEYPTGDLLLLRLVGGAYHDESRIRIREGSGFWRDRSDALKLFSHASHVPQLYSLTSDNVRVAVNTFPWLDVEREIPLGTRIPEDGEYTLAVQEMGGIFQAGPLLLIDKHEGNVHDLRENPTYEFIAQAGHEQGRFRLRFSPLDDDDPVSIPETDAQDALKLWFHDNTLYVDNASGDMDLRLYDSAGRFLQSFRAGFGIYGFELHLSAGVYVVRCMGKTHCKPLRIVIY